MFLNGLFANKETVEKILKHIHIFIMDDAEKNFRVYSADGHCFEIYEDENEEYKFHFWGHIEPFKPTTIEEAHKIVSDAVKKINN